MDQCEHLSTDGTCAFIQRKNRKIASQAVTKIHEWFNWWSGRGGITKWNECTVGKNVDEQRKCSGFKPKV